MVSLAKINTKERKEYLHKKVKDCKNEKDRQVSYSNAVKMNFAYHAFQLQEKKLGEEGKCPGKWL